MIELKVYKNRLSHELALSCERARKKKCRCRCGGRLHGESHLTFMKIEGDFMENKRLDGRLVTISQAEVDQAIDMTLKS